RSLGANRDRARQEEGARARGGSALARPLAAHDRRLVEDRALPARRRGILALRRRGLGRRVRRRRRAALRTPIRWRVPTVSSLWAERNASTARVPLRRRSSPPPAG